MISSQLASSESSSSSSLTPLPMYTDALSPSAKLRPEWSSLKRRSSRKWVLVLARASTLSCAGIKFAPSLLLGNDFNGNTGEGGTDVWVALSSDVRSRTGELKKFDTNHGNK